MLQIENPSAPAISPPRFALWQLGFRPFYLLASSFAALSVLLWIAQYTGWLHSTVLRGPAWHAHEMLFGFTVAVIAGFLFTAVRNWTNQPTPTGAPLAALALLWLAGRVLVLTPYALTSAIVNAAFPLAVAVGIAIPLIRSRNQRNYFFIGLLVLLACATLAAHLAHSGVIAWPTGFSLRAGLDVVLFIIAVMGGRVIPMFTNNALPGTQARRHPQLEKIALGGLLLLIASDLFALPAIVQAVLCLLLALAHGARLALWQSWHTRHTSILWVLHLSYAWIVVYLLLRGLAALGVVSELVALHALTIGGIGGMIIGMITRTARGHTARPLKADRWEIACYALVHSAALIRVISGIALPSHYVAGIVLAGLCWSLAFGIYAVRYWPVLTRPRLDGRPG